MKGILPGGLKFLVAVQILETGVRKPQKFPPHDQRVGGWVLLVENFIPLQSPPHGTRFSYFSRRKLF